MLLGLDLGTAGAHAIAIDATGASVASAFSEYGTHSPRPGWFEQDPADWRRAALDVLAGVAAAVRGEIRGLGLTGQPGCVFAASRFARQSSAATSGRPCRQVASTIRLARND